MSEAESSERDHMFLELNTVTEGRRHGIFASKYGLWLVQKQSTDPLDYLARLAQARHIRSLPSTARVSHTCLLHKPQAVSCSSIPSSNSMAS